MMTMMKTEMRLTLVICINTSAMGRVRDRNPLGISSKKRRLKVCLLMIWLSVMVK